VLFNDAFLTVWFRIAPSGGGALYELRSVKLAEGDGSIIIYGHIISVSKE
jgi:hypothetical protein